MKITIPELPLKTAADILKPYGVNLVALLEQAEGGEQEDKYLTVPEAMELTGFSRWTLDRADKAGKIRSFKPHPGHFGRVYYSRTSLIEWFQSSRRFRPRGEEAAR